MKQQEIMWTALPNGVRNGRLRLSVFVSPRLKTDETLPGKGQPVLEQFPDLLTWPEHGFNFVVHFDGGASVAADRVSPAPDLALWQALFKADTFVRPYEFEDLHKRTVRSYPVKHVMGFLKKQYQRIAVQSPVTFPTVHELIEQDDSILQIGVFQPPRRPGGAIMRPQRLKQGAQPADLERPTVMIMRPRSQQRRTQPGQRGPGITALRATPGQQMAKRSAEMRQVRLPAMTRARQQQLVSQLEGQLRLKKALPLAPKPNPETDFLQVKLFHRILNAPHPTKPGEHIRARVEVPKIDFHEMVSSLGDYPELMRRLGLVIDLEIDAPPGLPASTRVWVEAQWQQAPVVPTSNVMPKTKCRTQGGFAAQPKGDEIVNGMLRLREPGKSADQQRYDVVHLDVDGAATKAMAHADDTLRRVAFVAGTDQEPEPAGLPAMRSTGISLVRHERAVQLVAMLNAFRARAEAVKTNPSSDITLFAEDLVRGYRVDVLDDKSGRWRTLCARVGSYHFVDGDTTLEIEDEGWVSTGATEAADDSSDDLHLPETLCRWAGWSLVAPRPGRRLNPQDIPEDFENKAATDFGLEVNFRAAPGSLPRLRFGTIYTLRARTVDLAGNGLSLQEADAVTSGPAANEVTTQPVRYTRFEPVPSPVTLLRKSIANSPGESLEHLVIRSFNDSPSRDNEKSSESTERHIAPPLGAQLLAETHGMFDTPEGMNKAAYDMIVQREGTFQVGDAADEQAHPEAQLQVPYLPDPLARGAALLGLPGTPPDKPTEVEFSGDWPDFAPFRVRLVEGTGAPQWDPGRRVLTVFIPKAEMARVRLSSRTPQQNLGVMGMMDWINEAGAPSPMKLAARDHAIRGRHWMVTPFRELLLVHAVQQPLITPKFRDLKANKSIGNTYAMLYDKFPISGKSTAKLDVLAEWKEPVDPLSEPAWKTIPGNAHVCELPLEREDTVANIVRQRHEFGDTKYRRVKYTAVATTRFREYLPFTDEQIESGEKVITRSSKPVTVDVLSSARPESPRVLYVVPTFGWEKKETSDGRGSVRAGGGLRVYLERPWFSSGDGELLGVVLPQQPIRRRSAEPVAAPGRLRRSVEPAAPSGRLRRLVRPIAVAGVTGRLAPYVTQWGADPLWATTAPGLTPPASAFKRAVAREGDLTLDEVQGAKVSVVGHEVAYDSDRQLWYCDIEIDPGESYFPFIRLALARYQPNSVKTPNADVKLSRVVLADFAQLAPDRSVAVSFDAADRKVVNVSLTGVTYRASGAGRGPSVAEVGVETRRPGVEDDLGWVPVEDGVFNLEPRSVSDNRTVWTGKVTLPDARGSRPFRLVIKEYELFRSTRPARTRTAIAAIPATDRRLVYADVVEL